MKIAATAFLVGCLIAAPAYSQEQAPKPPTDEEVLMDGLSNVTVCIRANMVATETVKAIIKKMQADGADKLNDDGTKVLNDAADAFNNLSMITDVEKIIGRSIVGMLLDDYDHTLEDINKSLMPIVKTTDQKMKEIFKDVEDFPEFTKIFMPKLEACSDMVEELSHKVKEIRETPKAPKKDA